MRVITPDMAGCWFDGASARTADELCVAVIDVALEYGWEPTDKADLQALNPQGWFDDPRDSEFASESADAAEQYLQSMAPDGYEFRFCDGFYLLAVCEHEGYEKDPDYPCPHGAECPND